MTEKNEGVLLLQTRASENDLAVWSWERYVDTGKVGRGFSSSILLHWRRVGLAGALGMPALKDEVFVFFFWCTQCLCNKTGFIPAIRQIYPRN